MRIHLKAVLTGFCFVCVPVMGTVGAESEARRLADAAFHQIEEHVFESHELSAAAITQAEQLDPQEARVYVAESLLTLVEGFMSGDWYQYKRFTEGTVEQACALADRAVALEPTSAFVLAHRGRLAIVQGDFVQAQETLERANALDPSDFYPWYYLGVLAEEQRDVERAAAGFDEAERRASRPFQNTLLVIHRQVLSSMRGDLATVEADYLELIRRNPEIPHNHGNYAEWLLKQHRYDEAVAEYEKAVELGPYPIAVEGLERARQQRDEHMGREDRQL